MSGRVLIKGGTVLSLDRSVGNGPGMDVLIEDGRIDEVGRSLRARGAEVIEATDAIVLPGFVDAHRHVWHALFRNAGSGPGAPSPAKVGPHYRPDHVYAATLAGLLGAAQAGITTVVDWADLSADPAFTDAALQAHADAGLRTVFVAARGEWETQPGTPEPVGRLADERSGPRLGFGYGPTDVPEDLDTVLSAWRAARDAGLRIHAHAGVGQGSGGRIARLSDSGLLSDAVTLVHCTNLDERDLDAVDGAGARVCLTPAVEMTSGMGAPPLQALIDRGLRPGLGVGSEIEAPGDMFAQMRSANSVQHATLFDLKLAGKGGVPNLLSTRDVIRYATSDGALAAGLGDVIGTLAPGKRGDVLILRTDLPNIAPVNDPIGAVVWGMDTSNVDWVLVEGEVLVRNGELTADVAKVRDLAVRAQGEVVEAAGLLAEAGAKQP